MALSNDKGEFSFRVRVVRVEEDVDEVGYYGSGATINTMKLDDSVLYLQGAFNDKGEMTTSSSSLYSLQGFVSAQEQEKADTDGQC